MEGDWEAGPLYAGYTCALIRDVEPVGEILSRMVRNASHALRSVSLRREMDRGDT